jgi:hypothetical protein
MEISLDSFSFHCPFAIYFYKAEVRINPTKSVGLFSRVYSFLIVQKEQTLPKKTNTVFSLLSGAQDPFLIQAGAYVDKVGMDHSAHLLTCTYTMTQLLYSVLS